jgi:hypothetical protein
MEKQELTSEEKLRKIVKEIIEARSDNISVKKLIEIIGFEPPSYKKTSNPFLSRGLYKEFHSSNEYKEDYIS